MSAFYDQASLVVVPSGYKSGVVYSQKPMTADGQLAFTRASTATRVNASGLIEEVASGVPRLDYLGGTCPKLLLEPQRTNLFPYSEYMNGLTFTQATATDNAETSPEGVINAARLYDNTVDAQHRVYGNISVTSGTTYTFSVFAKKGTLRYCYLLSTANGTERWFFDLQEGAAITSGGKIEDYGNGWYRLSVQVVPSSTGNSIFSFSLTNDAQDNTYIGTGTDYHIIYGFQLEAGSYPTSLIPTNGTSVTRVADAASKTGISSLIGQTEGTLYLEFSTQPEGSSNSRISISDGSNNNWIFLSKDGPEYRAYVRASNSIVYSNLSEEILDSSVVKMAIAYKSGEIAYYFNGTLRSSSSSFSFSATLDRLIIGNTNTVSDVLETIKINQALLFKTRLTNAQLAELTAV